MYNDSILFHNKDYSENFIHVFFSIISRDKHELISQEEEKQNLYSQLNVMR